MPKQNNVISSNDNIDKEMAAVDPHTSYVIDGKHFDVERVFKDNANDSLGTVLLKLIKAEIAPF